MEKTIIPGAMLIIISLLIGITLFRIENMPTEKVCPNFDKRSIEHEVYCKDYTFIEKVRYVWNLY